MRRRLLALLALAAIQACGSMEESIEIPLEGQPANVPPLGPEQDYLRISGRRREDSTWEWTGKASVRVLRHPESGVRVRLFALTHIGPASYYRSLEDPLRPADLIVYEGLKNKSAEVAPDSPLGWFVRHRASLQRLMDYTSQSAWEAGIKDSRWINVDCSVKGFGEGLPGGMADLVDESERQDTIRTEQLLERGGAAEEIAREQSRRLAGFFSWVLPGEDAPGTGSRKSQDPRNAAIFKWVKARLSRGREKDIALLYGASHAQALEPYFIRDLGFRLESVSWHEIQTFSLGSETFPESLVRGYLRYQEADYAGAESDLRQAVKLAPKVCIVEQLLFATLFQRNRTEEALAVLEKYLAAYPDDSAARRNLAVALFKLKRYPEAFREFDRVLLSGPSASRFHERGVFKRSTRDFPGAIEDFTRSLELDPAYVPSWHDRGLAHLDRKEPREALSDFARVLELEPAHAEALDRIADLRIDQKDYDGLIRDATRAIAKDPKQAQFYSHRGSAIYLKGEFGRSVEDLEKAVSLAPESALIWGRLGQSAHHAGDLARARSAFGKALQIDPKNYAVLFQRGTLSYEEQRWEQASMDFRKSGDLQPDSERVVQGRLWMIRSRRGDQAAATRDLMRFLAADTSTNWEWTLLAYLAGEIPEAKLVQLLETPGAHQDFRCAARFYVGTKRLLAGDKVAAMRYFKMNQDHAVCTSETHCSSLQELRRLETESSGPGR